VADFLIIRTSSLGDIIHTLPAFAALRRDFPRARIAWVVEEPGKAILDLASGLDDVIVVGTPGWRKRMARKDQIVLDFQGLIKSGLAARLSRSRRRIGFHRKNLKEPLASVFYTERADPFPETEHVIRKNLSLLRRVGVAGGDRIDFPISIQDSLSSSVREKLAAAGYRAGQRLVLVNVGAAWPSKRWFAKSWVEVLSAVKGDDLFPLLLWGNSEERLLAEDVSRQTGVSMAPFLSVQEIIALVKDAALVVSGDTFALQAACALGVPVVGIFGPTSPGRNGPFRPRDKAAYHEIACSLCYKRLCRSVECLELVTPAEVLSLIRQALKENG